MDTKEYIIAAVAVVKTAEFLKPTPQNGNIRVGFTHAAILECNAVSSRKAYNMEDAKGFLTSRLRFVNRWEAMVIAKGAGQTDSDGYTLYADSIDLKTYYERYLSECPENAGLLGELEE